MATIGIFDSGLGGLSVYREIRKLLPTERYIYFADNAFCPYGTKSQTFIQERAREITELLVRRGAEIIVRALQGDQQIVTDLLPDRMSR